MRKRRIDELLAMSEADNASVADLGELPKPAAVTDEDDDLDSDSVLPADLMDVADDLAQALIGAMSDVLSGGGADALDDVNKIVGDDDAPPGDDVDVDPDAPLPPPSDDGEEDFGGDDPTTGKLAQDQEGDQPTEGDELSRLKQRCAAQEATIAELKAKLAKSGKDEADADRDNYMTDADDDDLNEGGLDDEDPDPAYDIDSVDSTLGVDYSDIGDSDGKVSGGEYDDDSDDKTAFVQVLEADDDAEDDDDTDVNIHIDNVGDDHDIDDDDMDEDDGADKGDAGDVSDVEEFDPEEFKLDDLGG